MRISKHAYKRMSERGLDLAVLTIVEEVILPKYLNQSHQIFLKKKTAWEIARILRKTADKVEKHSGTQMIIDSSGSTLITAYRRKK
jgi:hypothetical protein